MSVHRLQAVGVSHVWKDHDHSVTALNNVSAEFVSGAPHFICGPSGAGKSTLGIILAGLISPAVGQVRIDQLDIRKARPKLAYLFQFPEAIFFADTIEKELLAISGRDDQGNWEFAFESLGMRLDDVRSRHPFTLSEGYARLAALAMQLARQPEVLILDEPTIGLDWKHQERVVEFLRGWVDPDRIMITITHDTDLLAALEGKSSVITGGQLTWTGSTVDLLRDESLMRMSALAA